MSKCDPSENNKEYIKLKTYDFWQNYLKTIEEWGRGKVLIEYLMNAAFNEYYRNIQTPNVTKDV